MKKSVSETGEVLGLTLKIVTFDCYDRNKKSQEGILLERQ